MKPKSAGRTFADHIKTKSARERQEWMAFWIGKLAKDVTALKRRVAKLEQQTKQTK